MSADILCYEVEETVCVIGTVYYDGMGRCLSCTTTWKPSDGSEQRSVRPKNKINDRKKAPWSSA